MSLWGWRGKREEEGEEINLGQEEAKVADKYDSPAPLLLGYFAESQRSSSEVHLMDALKELETRHHRRHNIFPVATCGTTAKNKNDITECRLCWLINEEVKHIVLECAE